MNLKPLGPNLPARLLARLYLGAVSLRNRYYDRFTSAAKKTGRFTISIGGINAGGSGKTPITALAARLLQECGYQPAILSRGYKRRYRSPVIARPGEVCSWDRIGDEPALLQRTLPDIWLGIGPDRCHCAEQILPHSSNTTVFVLDDGFQHRRIFRDRDIVCLPADPFSDYAIPAGTRREPIGSLQRAHGICLTGQPQQEELLRASRSHLSSLFPKKPVCILLQKPGDWVNLRNGNRLAPDALPLESPLLLTGIARPERFVSLVRGLQIAPGEIVHRPDHHAFSRQELERIAARAPRGVITTEKDAIRLMDPKLVLDVDIWYLTLVLAFLDSASQQDFIRLITPPTRQNAAGSH
jgi:tetraacyldisaccharide 4'-kinase